MEHEEDIRRLFEKYLNGECTEQEIRLLFAHFELLDDEIMLRKFVQSAMDTEHTIDPLLRDKLDVVTGRVEKKLTDAIQQRRRSFFVRLRSKPALAIAATLLLFLSIGMLWYKQFAETEPMVEMANVDEKDVLPGGNLATLTLDDGSVIQLSTDQDGIVVGDDITYADGSTISDLEDGGLGIPDAPAIKNLQLTTPRGGTYQVTLSDGTKVWLNSASTLRYPSRFAGQERMVELEGEAYFEVSQKRSAAGKIPFHVVSKGQIVEVLGTQFNIAAYTDEEEVLTTLVEGSVRITPADEKRLAGQNQRYVVLRPGEQSVVNGGRMAVSSVDVTTFIAWKNGLFSFKETEMRHAMNQLARWYDVHIVYEGNIPETYFFGDIRRDKSLAQALTILKKSGVNFRIGKDGDRSTLVVLP